MKWREGEREGNTVKWGERERCRQNQTANATIFLEEREREREVCRGDMMW